MSQAFAVRQSRRMVGTDTFRTSAISSAYFPAESYSLGLFSYLYEVPASAQRFEVLDYWVRKL